MVKCLWSLTFFFHTWWKCCLSAFGAHVNQCGCGRQCTPQRKPFEAMVAVGLTGAHPRFNALQHCHILCNFRLKIYLCSPKNARQRSNSYFHMGKEALVDTNHSLHKFGAFVYFTYLFIKLILEVIHLLTRTSLPSQVHSQQARYIFIKGCTESPQEVFAAGPVKFIIYLNTTVNKTMQFDCSCRCRKKFWVAVFVQTLHRLRSCY